MVMNTDVTMGKVFSVLGAHAPPSETSGDLDQATTVKLASKGALGYVANRHEVCHAAKEHKVYLYGLCSHRVLGARWRALSCVVV